jgi:hypothetical protein
MDCEILSALKGSVKRVIHVDTPCGRYFDDHTNAAAVDELEFLRSLLPSEEEDR